MLLPHHFLGQDCLEYQCGAQAPPAFAWSPTGSLRMRLPVAAKIALVSAGMTHAVAVSPIPPGAAVPPSGPVLFSRPEVTSTMTSCSRAREMTRARQLGEKMGGRDRKSRA